MLSIAVKATMMIFASSTDNKLESGCNASNDATYLQNIKFWYKNDDSHGHSEQKEICPSFEHEPDIKRPVNQDLKKDLPPSYVRILTKIYNDSQHKIMLKNHGSHDSIRAKLQFAHALTDLNVKMRFSKVQSMWGFILAIHILNGTFGSKFSLLPVLSTTNYPILPYFYCGYKEKDNCWIFLKKWSNSSLWIAILEKKQGLHLHSIIFNFKEKGLNKIFSRIRINNPTSREGRRFVDSKGPLKRNGFSINSSRIIAKHT